MTTFRTIAKRPQLLAALATGAAALVLPAIAQAQSLTLDIGEPTVTSRIVQMVLLLTVLSLAPSILLMVTSFTRIVVVLSLLRSALGLQQSPPNAVLIGLAMFLTAFIMAPTFDAAWREGVQPMMDGRDLRGRGHDPRRGTNQGLHAAACPREGSGAVRRTGE
jgi:flagellar biosynthetic protein FliP